MSTTRGIELAHLPERERAVTLQRQVEARRDDIATRDQEIDELRQTLTGFEAYYHTRLARQEERLTRLGGLIRHVERWLELLQEAPREQVTPRAMHLEDRRRQEAAALFRRRQARATEPWTPADAPANAPVDAPRGEHPEALKLAYRRLVRRYHPDLARTEEERLRCVVLMQRVNALYRAGDLGRLQALAESETDPDSLGGELPLPEQIALLEERLAWFEAVLHNLDDERAELESCDLHRLWRRAADHQAQGDDLFDELARELDDRLARRRQDVAWAYSQLEHTVKRFNRHEHAVPANRTQAQSEALERVFDPLADRPLVRLGLETLQTAEVRPAVRQQARWVESLPESQPALLRLLLFAHVGELSHLPLPGLETYEDLRVRFESLSAAPSQESAHASLEEILAEAGDLVEYGVRRATESLVYLGLRFRSASTREAMPLALQAAPVRRAFREVLKVLGEQALCTGCGQDTFAIPLFRTRGLDDLRATVCPACGHVRQRYYLPKGDDVQTILNRAYVDLELVTEWSFRLARATVSTQLLPVEVDTLTVGDLKARLVEDLFQRYELGVTRGQVELRQQDRRVAERTPLGGLADRQFTLRLRPGANVNGSDALELLRHRIRNRFK